MLGLSKQQDPAAGTRRLDSRLNQRVASDRQNHCVGAAALGEREDAPMNVFLGRVNGLFDSTLPRHRQALGKHI